MAKAPPFKKGQSGNPKGRPVGSVNKNYLSLQFWFGVISENTAKLSPQEQIAVAKECAGMLLAKVQNIPAALTPLPGAALDKTEDEKMAALEAEVIPPPQPPA